MISNDELYHVAEAERRRLQDGGYTLNLVELQQAAREYAGEHNEQTEIAVFHVLEQVNDQERNRRLWDKNYHLFSSIAHNREIHRIELSCAKKAKQGNLQKSLDELRNENRTN